MLTSNLVKFPSEVLAFVSHPTSNFSAGSTDTSDATQEARVSTEVLAFFTYIVPDVLKKGSQNLF